MSELKSDGRHEIASPDRYDRRPVNNWALTYSVCDEYVFQNPPDSGCIITSINFLNLAVLPDANDDSDIVIYATFQTGIWNHLYPGTVPFVTEWFSEEQHMGQWSQWTSKYGRRGNRCHRTGVGVWKLTTIEVDRLSSTF
jgi:hypothetical protein